MDSNEKLEALEARHIQNFSADSRTITHWGYAERLVPCLNDPGTCEYLDLVYSAHDTSLVFTGVFWVTVVSVLFVWGVSRLFWPTTSTERGGLVRLFRAVSSSVRHHLLADFMRPIFGRTTRLQVLLLAILAGYLLIWSFVGLAWRTWRTPVAGHEQHNFYNTRTSLGPWSDRIGILAFGLTPLSVLLASRESLLSVITGVSYQKFNFLHRWLGYIIVVQSSLHTIGWCIVEIRLYQPQPTVAQKWIKQLYMIWGVVAMILLLMLYVLSLPFVIRRTGYEFFRKSHYVLAMVYIGACIGHWEKLHCFLTPSILLWGIDRAVRLLRTFMIHHEVIDGRSRFFAPAIARGALFLNETDGDIVRLDFEHPHKPWKVGQHFYLCFTEGSIWQSHPLTPLSFPENIGGKTAHAYVFRAKAGETRKMAKILAEKPQGECTTPVILTGPYGEDITQSLTPTENILCVAGGTGITYVLPALLFLKRDTSRETTFRNVELVWFVRHKADMDWIKPELQTLQSEDITIRVFSTRDGQSGDLPLSPSSPDSSTTAAQSSDDEKTAISSPTIEPIPERAKMTIQRTPATLTTTRTGHPDVRQLVTDFLENTVAGSTTVFASGPGDMMSDLREVIAQCNSGKMVWKGKEKYDVSLQCDDRLEY